MNFQYRSDRAESQLNYVCACPNTRNIFLILPWRLFNLRIESVNFSAPLRNNRSECY